MIKAKFGEIEFTIRDNKTINTSEVSKITALENLLDEIILDYDKPTSKIPASFLADSLENMGFERPTMTANKSKEIIKDL